MATPFIKPRVPRGMRDILPEQMIRRQYVIDVIRDVFEEFGFEPLQTPALELSEVLTGKYGPDAEKLIYQAGHMGGKENISLRYDLSVPLCRVVAMHPQLPKPFKRYQIDPVWRAERPQKGRYRQFFQCDADTVGTESMLADAENVTLIYQVLTRLGFEQFEININDRKLITGIGQFAGVPDEQLGGLYRSIDKLDKIGLAGVRDELAENQIPEPVIEKLLALLQIDGDSATVLNALREQLGDSEVAREGIAELEELNGYLVTLGVPDEFYRVNVSMVRGLEYYTGPIYETVVEEPKIGSITGGGRYDELIGSFSKQGYPATGTSFGIERIIDVMEEFDMFPTAVGKTVTQVLVTVFDAELAQESLKLATLLRQDGIKTEVYCRPTRLSTQIKYADTKGIPYAVILGSDELEAGAVAIRNLASREQQIVPREELVEHIQRWIDS
ncbi:MAG: histidine--tRNA ligase [Candidatus Poribacteria bacterium]|nr:histidine--tRNA ligase [Candidatus Poribacteria bacterium]